MRRDCERARHWASLEVDGELSPFELVLLESHTCACPGCREFREDIGRITTDLRGRPLQPLTHAVEIRQARRPRFRIAPAAAALAVAAVGLGSILASVQVRPPQAAGDEQTEASGTRSAPNSGVAPLAVLRHEAINLAAHRQLVRAQARRTAAPDLPGGPVISEK
jgi:ferric-dicitrate binding protein FerR (iron transport regulator)